MWFPSLFGSCSFDKKALLCRAFFAYNFKKSIKFTKELLIILKKYGKIDLLKREEECAWRLAKRSKR